MNWYRILLRLLGDEYQEHLDNLAQLVGYQISAGPNDEHGLRGDVFSMGNIVCWADARKPKKEEHDSPWPYLFDHEFLYLSRNHREKVAHAKFREQLNTAGKFRTDWYDDSRGRLVDFGLSPWDVAFIIMAQLELGRSFLKASNEFYIGTKYTRKFRIKVYYQKPTPKRYPKGLVTIHVDKNPDALDTWGNPIQGNTRIFFNAGRAEVRQKTHETVPIHKRHPAAQILSSDSV